MILGTLYLVVPQPAPSILVIIMVVSPQAAAGLHYGGRCGWGQQGAELGFLPRRELRGKARATCLIPELRAEPDAGKAPPSATR